MKRFCLTAVLVLAAALHARAASSMFYNNGLITTPPVIDATNFVNEGRIEIATSEAFEFSSVLNFTNRGTMRNGFLDGLLFAGGSFGTSGFRFDTAPPTDMSWNRRPAANFFNAPQVGNVATNATIYGDYHLDVQATNIIQRGAMRVSQFGVVSLAGRSVDVSGGVLATAGFGTRTPTAAQGIYDNYWNFGTNNIIPDQHVILNFPNTPIHEIINFPPPYFTNQNILSLFATTTNSLTATEFITEAGTNRSVQIVFVRNPNPNITTTVYRSGGTPTQPGATLVEWLTYYTNRAGIVRSNTLYLRDTFALGPTNAYITNYPYSPPPPSVVAVPPRSFQPYNFSITRTTPFLLGFLETGNDFTDKPSAFWGIGGAFQTISNAVYSAYGATINSTPAISSDPVTVRGTRGRVEVTADRNFAATNAVVDALTYLKLGATNHFSGASNAFIAAPYADIALGSTNGFLNMSSVFEPVVHRLSGTIQCYSTVWTNTVFFNGDTNPVVFNVLYVDSDLADTLPAQIFDASLRATNVEVGDSLYTLNSLSIDADRLNITTNGSITIASAGINWETSVPHLKTLTNRGTITAASVLTFTSHTSGGAAKPMDALVNYGSILGAGVTMSMHNLENQGGIVSLYGPLALRAGTNVNLSASGILSAPEADVSIFCRNLYVTNQNILPGRMLNLYVTNQLLAGTNFWSTYEGVNLPVRPTNSALNHVTLETRANIPSQPATHVWAGLDRGVSVSGFSNNVALGVLVLDGAVNSQFIFTGNGASSNALYVDRLDLLNNATQIDAQGNLSQLSISPGMTIYYAQATMNGGSAAEFMDGKNGGRLRWINNYAGPYSGTNVVYPDGTTNFLNAALVTSCNLDSDNDGTPNCLDPSPVPVPGFVPVALKIVSTPSPTVVLSWPTVSGAINRIYSADKPSAVNWQLVTNVVSPALPGTFTNQYQTPISGSSRFYRVKVEPPQP